MKLKGEHNLFKVRFGFFENRETSYPITTGGEARALMRALTSL